jgi:DNA primase
VISPQTIALVRERTDIVALIQESVPTLKRRGRSFVGLCPFHKEKSPSFHVNQERGFFHCFGCKESGSGIDFLMKLEGLTFPEAVRALAERSGVEVEEERTVDRSEAERQKRAKDDLYAVNNLAAAYFEKMLREHPERRYALDELARRGLRPSWASPSQPETPERPENSSIGAIDDTLQAFRIGYAPPGWDGLANFLRTQGVSPVAAEQTGLLVPRSSGSGHYDRFRHRLMFAVIDPQGRVIAFSGRALEAIPDPQRKPGEETEKPAKYINSPESPIYSKGYALFGLYQARHTIRTSEQAIVVEGNFDVVSLHARGINNVVAPLGTAFTADQAKLLRRFAPSCVLLFDGDHAGRKAVRLSRAPLKEAGVAAKVAVLPDGVDPDELVRTRGSEALLGILERAAGMLEFLIDDALDQGFVEADARERVGRVNAVAKLLADEDDPLTRMMAKDHANRIAGRVDLKTKDWQARRVAEETFRALEQTVKRALVDEDRVIAQKPGETREPPRRARIAAKPPGSVQRAQIVVSLLEYPELLRDAEVSQSLELLEGPSARTVATLGQATGGGTRPLDVSPFLAQLPPAVQSFAAKRLAAPEFENVDQARAEIFQNAAKLRELLVASDTRELGQEAARAAGDWEAEVRFAVEAQARVRSIKGSPARSESVSAGAPASPAMSPAASPAALPTTSEDAPAGTMHADHAEERYEASYEASEDPVPLISEPGRELASGPSPTTRPEEEVFQRWDEDDV